MSNFFTRTGDDGTTNVLGSGRVRKDDVRLEAIGAIDEANAALGLARAFCGDIQCNEIILSVQRDLYKLMSEVAATPENAERFREINSERIIWLEKSIENLEEQVDPVREFIIPGDTQIGAALDLARSIIRRAERRVTKLHLDGSLENINLVQYLNRLSSLIFVLELFAYQQSGSGKITLAKE